MSFTIAVSGKGGVGKTTIAGLLISSLISRNLKPVLAVDADPNTCLDTVLGVSIQKTIGGVREEAKEIAGKGMAGGITKQQLLELKIEESLVEMENFDLIAMGRPEGPGCYCYANNVLKTALSKMTTQYPYVVLDNEAGLENLSRRIIQHVNLFVMVTDPSQRGLETITRLHALAKEMGIHYDQLAVIVNRLRKNKQPEISEKLKETLNAEIIIGIPDDDELAEFAEEGKSLFQLSKQNPAFRKLDEYLSDFVK